MPPFRQCFSKLSVFAFYGPTIVWRKNKGDETEISIDLLILNNTRSKIELKNGTSNQIEKGHQHTHLLVLRPKSYFYLDTRFFYKHQ